VRAACYPGSTFTPVLPFEVLSHMYNPTVGCGTGGALTGAALGAQCQGPIGHVAQSVLPFTGAAFGLYLATGLGLLVTGIVMRRLGRGTGQRLARGTEPGR
jgi:fructose-specific phosphotransferase system IIC component